MNPLVHNQLQFQNKNILNRSNKNNRDKQISLGIITDSNVSGRKRNPKNYEILNCNYFFSLKYKKVFSFINQLLDINAYLLLKKEFEIMKHIYCSEEDLITVEKKSKININSTKFSRDIKDCIEHNKFFIFYQKKK